MKFKDFQKQFAESISSNVVMENLGEHIEPVGRLNVEGVFSTYRDDYQARLTSALSHNFETVEQLVGKELFFQLAMNYVVTHPSPHFDLGMLGDDFPAFLKNHPISVELPELYIIAQCDLDFWQVFNSPSEQGISAEEFASKEISEKSKFQFVPSFILRQEKVNAGALWQDIRDQKPSSEWSQSDHSKNYFWSVYKSNSQVKFKIIDPFSFKILHLLSNNSCLGEAIECVSKEFTDTSPDKIQSLFAFMANERILHKFD